MKNYLSISGLVLLALSLGLVENLPTWTETPPADARVHRDVEFAKPDGQSLTLDLYLPAKADHPLPLVIWIHGGYWQKGDKDPCTAMPLVYRGYAVASINYRLAPKYIFPAQLHDCKAAVRFLRANSKKYNLDPDHFGAWGDSAGAHLAALLGTTGEKKELEGDLGNPGVSSRVRAVCDWFGCMDLSKVDKPSSRNPIAVFLGATNERNAAISALASPVTHVDKNSAAFLIMHGAKDKYVPLEQGQLMEAALKKAGVDVKFSVYPDLGHWDGWTENQQVLNEIISFFDSHLKK